MKLLVFDSHPVQYRAPVWRQFALHSGHAIHVVYATDCSLRGHIDSGFGQTVVWDDPILEGYPYTVLNCENNVPLSGWNSLTGSGVAEILDRIKPDAILLTGLNYRYDLVAYFFGWRRKIPVWLRCESQDEAFPRSKWKSVVRSLAYRLAYYGIDRFFYIGELNRRHYLKHGVSKNRLIPARYATVDRFKEMSREEKIKVRLECRSKAGIPNDALVVGFSGKLITKKNPDILYQMMEFLPPEVRRSMFLYFIGSGELEDELRGMAAAYKEEYGVGSYFAGFINQSKLPAHYLAMDVMVLPSRQMGETWGLVCNEAMQAGCSVVVSNAVGCSEDFRNWERFRVFKTGQVTELAMCIAELAPLTRKFDWASDGLKEYSLEATARTLALAMEHDA